MIRQKFEPELLLPAESYLRSFYLFPGGSSPPSLLLCCRRWINLHDEFYPENGWTADIYTGHINHTHLLSLDKMVNDLQNLADQKLYLKSNFYEKPRQESLIFCVQMFSLGGGV